MWPVVSEEVSQVSSRNPCRVPRLQRQSEGRETLKSSSASSPKLVGGSASPGREFQLQFETEIELGP